MSRVLEACSVSRAVSNASIVTFRREFYIRIVQDKGNGRMKTTDTASSPARDRKREGRAKGVFRVTRGVIRGRREGKRAMVNKNWWTTTIATKTTTRLILPAVAQANKR